MSVCTHMQKPYTLHHIYTIYLNNSLFLIFGVEMSFQIRPENDAPLLASIDEAGSIVYDTPGRWVCQKCGGDFVSNLNPPFWCSCCERKTNVKSLTPPVFKEEWTPYGKPVIYGDLDGLFQEISVFIQDHIRLREPEEYMIMALWIIASYKKEFFDAVPYLQFIGPIECGKTRALKILGMLSFCAVNTSSISPSALCRLIEGYKTTVLVDQAEQEFSRKTPDGVKMYRIFMCGYSKGDKYIVASKEDEVSVVSRDVFGFKAVASTKVFDDAFASRSIQFRMRQRVPKVKDIRDDTRKRAQAIRNKLLYYYLRQEPVQKVDIPLTGRRRELYLPLLAVGHDFGIDWDDLKYYVKRDRQKLDEEQRNSTEGSVLQTIKKYYQGIDEQESIRTVEIALELDIKPNRLGYILRGMNIPRKRLKAGMCIDLTDKETQEELEDLFIKYKLEV